MPVRPIRLQPKTRRVIAEIFARLDYRKLGPIYCDVGGQAFWRERRELCRKLGIKLAEVLRRRLAAGGESLYVGAGVADRTWTVSMPSTPGSYEFRLFLNNGFTLLATSPPVIVN